MSEGKKHLSEDEINQLAERFEGRRVEEVLEWAVEQYSPRLVMTSNFGVDGIVLMDKLVRIARETPIIYLETGFQFAETDQLKDRLAARYDINLIVHRAEITVFEQNKKYGEKLYQNNPDLCCQLRKVEPLRRALVGYDAWLAALRRDQSPSRAQIKTVEWNAKHQLVKINPLASWTRREIWEYVIKHDLPYNPLHDDGYTSIGCEPCTRQVSTGAHERSGRWVGQNKVECGIHL